MSEPEELRAEAKARDTADVDQRVATMATMVVRLNVALVRLDAALNAFSREMARLRRPPANGMREGERASILGT